MMNLHRGKKTITYLLVLIVIIFGAINFSKAGGGSMNEQIIHSDEEYYFQMDENKLKDFLIKIRMIEVGIQIEKVKSILGKPTYDKKLVDKKGNFKANVLLYYTKIYRKGLVNEKYDEYVRFVFNEFDSLIKIESNIKEISNKNSDK